MTEATTVDTDRTQGAWGMAGTSGVGDMICAAVGRGPAGLFRKKPELTGNFHRCR